MKIDLSIAGSRGRQSGFTLVELMIVVVVVAILASIAIPSYTDYVTSARRSGAQQQMLRIQTQQEQFFTDNKIYAPNLAALGYDSNVIASDEDGDIIGFLDEGMQYAYVSQPRDQIGTTGRYLGYELVAVAWNVQQTRDTGCTHLYLTQNGAKTHAGDAAECW